ncbi:hypothetical protein Scep_024688 [Stephania cephalantha]|uniref:Uncharacterized protein n=1 Tax=Stephania cephalantha TaxID=152367 RepID=A0AAP0F4B3_9MAGN
MDIGHSLPSSRCSFFSLMASCYALFLSHSSFSVSYKSHSNLNHTSSLSHVHHLTKFLPHEDLFIISCF